MPLPRLTLDDDALTRLFTLWNIPLPATGLVLFALRGAVPLESPGHGEEGAESGAKEGAEEDAQGDGWRRRATLELMRPDHIHMRCTLGIWNRATRHLFVARGSTVPHRDNVLKAAARTGAMKGRGTNQLEPGYYTDLTKGEHLQGKPQGHAALRQTGYRFYRRAHLGHLADNGTVANGPDGPRDALYTARDPLFFGNPYDNLHCAWNNDPDGPGFRSAGCLVVAGWPHSPRLPDARPNQGAWKTFHDLIYAAPQDTFPLLLLPAQEAAEALASPENHDALSPPSAAPRLVYGSEGEVVKALQRRLYAQGVYTGRITGRLGASTYKAWTRSEAKTAAAIA